MAVLTDTLEGTIDGAVWYHYDLGNDVLYVRLACCRDVETVSEESPDGFLLLRRQDNGQVAGLTVVNWWKRFGQGELPGSIHELERWIEPWGRRLAA